MGTRIILLSFVLISLAGCISENNPGESPFEDSSSPWIDNGPSTDVLLLHGFSQSGISNPTNWDLSKTALPGFGVEGKLQTVAYYGCDVGFDTHVESHGTHAGYHENSDCGPQSHTTNTEINHLSQHFAWLVYDEYASSWQCVDVLAHSMGGLILRLALYGVEPALPGYPPEMCVQDAVTMGTPHAGAGFLGELCASLVGYTQCQQMTDSQFLTNLANVAPNPQGSHRTDWTVIAAYGDAVVPFDSATAMPVPSVTFLGSHLGHIGSTGYQEIDPWGAYAVRFEDSTPLIAYDAPGPLAWAAEALLGNGFSLTQGSTPVDPQAQTLAPSANIGIVPGQSVEFEASCLNQQQDLLGGRWWAAGPNGEWTGQAFDSVQINSSPWVKSHIYTFPYEGTYSVAFSCLNRVLSNDVVTWSVTVDPSYNDIPTAIQYSPAAHVSATSSAINFAGGCDNPNHDLSYASWETSSNAQSWQVWERDTVQWHDDPWTTSTTVNFATPGTHYIRLVCVDVHQAQSEVVWRVDYTPPAGPTAYRYSPTVSSGSVNQGDTVVFEAGCSNPDGDLDRGEWWTRVGGSWTLDHTDYVNWSSNPWDKTRSYTFSGQGSYGIRFKCVNAGGGEGFIDWDIESI